MPSASLESIGFVTLQIPLNYPLWIYMGD